LALELLLLNRRPTPAIDTFPYTTLFRSRPPAAAARGSPPPPGGGARPSWPPRGGGRAAGVGGPPLGRGGCPGGARPHPLPPPLLDRKSTRLNSSHVSISYAVF